MDGGKDLVVYHNLILLLFHNPGSVKYVVVPMCIFVEIFKPSCSGTAVFNSQWPRTCVAPLFSIMMAPDSMGYQTMVPYNGLSMAVA